MEPRRKPTEKLTLPKVLAYSNDEIMSNMGRLASLIQNYEKIEWGDAMKKASSLMAEEKELLYIKKVRANPLKQTAETEEVKGPAEPKKPSLFDDPMYHDNYKRLLKLAPGIVDHLRKTDFKTEQLYGKSERTGYKDLSIEVLSKEDDEYILILTQYDGKLKPKPSMVLRLDLENEIVEAMEFTDPLTSKRVYSMESRRKFVDLEEQERQNHFLSDWLQRLSNEKHLIKWRERSGSGIESVIIDQYRKSEREANESPKSDRKESKAEKKAEPDREQERKTNNLLPESKLNELAIAIQLFENIEIEQARKRAAELAKNDLLSLVNLLLHGCVKLEIRHEHDLAKWNYASLLCAVPQLLNRLTDESQTVRLTNGDSKMPVYDFAHATDKSGKSIKFVVYESSKQSKEGTLIIVVEDTVKTARVELLSGGFFEQKTFHSMDRSLSNWERRKMLNMLHLWLSFLIMNDYKPEWNEVDETKVIHQLVTTEEDTEDPHYINAGIPDFAIGQVKLVEAHTKHGVTQEMIDQINQSGRGILLKPRTGAMVYNTKNVGRDAMIQAKPPGLRLSPRGRFYIEGRSNRSDRTHNQGL